MATGGGGGDPQKLDVHSYNQYKCYQSPDSVPDRCLVLLQVFQTGFWFCYKCSRQTGVQFWRKLGFGQHFGFLFSIPIFYKNTKRDGVGGWLVAQVSTSRGGGGGGPAQFRPIWTNRNRGEGRVQKLDINFVCHKCMVPQG